MRRDADFEFERAFIEGFATYWSYYRGSAFGVNASDFRRLVRRGFEEIGRFVSDKRLDDLLTGVSHAP